MKFPFTFCLLGISLFILASGCTTKHGSEARLSLPPAPPATGDHYGIHPGDLLTISFAGEPDLTQQVRVDWNGMINMPTLAADGSAEMKASGLSPAALATRLSAFAMENKMLVNARAQVLVSEYASQAYVVLGQVTQPGRYNFPRGLPPHLAVEEAIALAGGYTRLARQSQVLIKRGTDVYSVDLTKLATQSGHPPVIIIPGDVITIGERLF